MDGSIRLRPGPRKALLHAARFGADRELRLRAHILLLLADKHSRSLIASVLFTSSSTINRWRTRFLDQGLDAVLHAPGRRRPSRFLPFFIELVFRWVTLRSPRDFGLYRSRWTCGAVVLLLKEEYQLEVGRETVRRWLHQKDLVYRRPRPTLRLKDPERARKLRKIRELLLGLPASEIAVFQDEVDVNTNPKIGSMWMLKGKQAEVQTPGNNQKRYLAGSIDARTGQLTICDGPRRNAELFVEHLDELRRRYRRYKVIHVICDNAAFHKPDRSTAVRAYLERWGHRVKLHYLPTYAPETNPIERVWWQMHERITRNHRCEDIQELLDLVIEWLLDRSSFPVETSLYEQKQAA
ncbi:MAG: IS630 family transposase [Gemmataceae bacterium]|nr:IS630 family transposase [Gemmataceae bacterium]